MGAAGEGDNRLPARGSQVSEQPRRAARSRRLWWLGLMALLTMLLAVAVMLLSESAAA